MRALKTTNTEEKSEKTLKRPNAELAQETAQVVTALMNAATSLHKLHLQVTGVGSYAQHIALNELYDVMHGYADTLAEGFQGASETLLKYENDAPIVLNSVKEAIVYLKELTEEVVELQSIMPYSEIVNNLDLVKDSINSAKYKLIFLS
jgi:DNA-binding ferritin-like protein